MATINGVTNSSSNSVSDLKLGVYGVNNDIRNEILNRNIGKYQLYSETLDPAIGDIYDPYDFEGKLPESKDNGGIMNDTYNIETRKLAQTLAALYGNRDKTAIEKLLYYKSTDVTPAFMKRWFGVYKEYDDYTEYTASISVGTDKTLTKTYADVVKNALGDFTATTIGDSVAQTATNIANKIDSILSYVSLDYVLDKYENSVGVVRDLQMPVAVAATGGSVATTNVNGSSDDTALGYLSTKYYSNTLYSAAQYASYRRGKFSSTKYITESYEGKYGNTLATVLNGEGLPALITGSIQWLKTINRIKEIDSATYITAFTQSDNIELLASKIGVTGKEIAPAYYGKYSNSNHYVGNGKKERIIVSVLGSGITKTYEWAPDNKEYTTKDTLVGQPHGKTSVINGTYYQHNDSDRDGDNGKGSLVKDGSSSKKIPYYNDFNVFTLSDSKDLISRTNKLFANNAMGTLIGRFKTGKNDNKAGLTQTAVNGEYGLSHGRNLLKKTPNTVNGYDNPYCRVWTYHHQYSTLGDRIRPFYESSSSEDKVPISAGKMQKNWHQFRNPHIGVENRLNTLSVMGKNGYVNITPTVAEHNKRVETKNCMFSIENLAWRDIARDQKGVFHKGGSTVEPNDPTLTPEQIGPNGGRIMWFPPYDIEFSETATANWTTNEFIGRGEPVLTYNNSRRHGTLSFTIVIDHPAILNYWKTKSKTNSAEIDENQEELLRFFAGCQTLDPSERDITDENVSFGDEGNIDDEDIVNRENDVLVYEFWPNNYSGDNSSADKDNNWTLDNYVNHATDNKVTMGFKTTDELMEAAVGNFKKPQSLDYYDTFQYLFGGNLLYLNEDAIAFSKKADKTGATTRNPEETQTTEDTIKQLLNEELNNEIKNGAGDVNKTNDRSLGQAKLPPTDENSVLNYYSTLSTNKNTTQSKKITSGSISGSTNINGGITIQACDPYNDSGNTETSSDSKNKSDAEILSELLSEDIFNKSDNYYDISLGYEMCSNPISTIFTQYYGNGIIDSFNPKIYKSYDWAKNNKATVPELIVSGERKGAENSIAGINNVDGSKSSIEDVNSDEFNYRIYYREKNSNLIPFYYDGYTTILGAPVERKYYPLKDTENEPLNAYSSLVILKDNENTDDSYPKYLYASPRLNTINEAYFGNIGRNMDYLDVSYRQYLCKDVFSTLTEEQVNEREKTSIDNLFTFCSVCAGLNNQELTQEPSDSLFFFPFAIPIGIKLNTDENGGHSINVSEYLYGVSLFKKENNKYYLYCSPCNNGNSAKFLDIDEIKVDMADKLKGRSISKFFLVAAIRAYVKCICDNVSEKNVKLNNPDSIWNFLTSKLYVTDTVSNNNQKMTFWAYYLSEHDKIVGDYTSSIMNYTSPSKIVEAKKQTGVIADGPYRMNAETISWPDKGKSSELAYLCYKEDGNASDYFYSVKKTMAYGLYTYAEFLGVTDSTIEYPKHDAKNNTYDYSNFYVPYQAVIDVVSAFYAYKAPANEEFYLVTFFLVPCAKLDNFLGISASTRAEREKLYENIIIKNQNNYEIIAVDKKNGLKTPIPSDSEMDSELKKKFLLATNKDENAQAMTDYEKKQKANVVFYEHDDWNIDGIVIESSRYKNFVQILQDWYYTLDASAGTKNNLAQLQDRLASAKTKLSAYDKDSNEYKSALIEEKNLEEMVDKAQAQVSAETNFNIELAERLCYNSKSILSKHPFVRNGIRLVKLNFKKFENFSKDYTSVDEMVKDIESSGWGLRELSAGTLNDFFGKNEDNTGNLGAMEAPLLLAESLGIYYSGDEGKNEFGNDLPEGIKDYMNDFYDPFYDANFDQPSWNGTLVRSYRDKNNKVSNEDKVYVYCIDLPYVNDEFKKWRRFWRKVFNCAATLADKELWNKFRTQYKKYIPDDNSIFTLTDSNITVWSGGTYITYAVDEDGKVNIKELSPEEYADEYNNGKSVKYQRTSKLMRDLFKAHIEQYKKRYKTLATINKGDSDYIKKIKKQLNTLIFIYGNDSLTYQQESATTNSDCDTSIEVTVSEKSGARQYFIILKQVSGALYRVKTNSDVTISSTSYESNSYNFNLLRDPDTGVLKLAQTAYDPDCALIKPLYDRKELLCGTHSFSSEDAFNKSGYKIGSYPVDDIKISVTGAASGTTNEKGIKGMAYTVKGAGSTKTWYYWDYSVGSGYTGNYMKVASKIVSIFDEIQDEIQDEVDSYNNYYFKTEDIAKQYGGFTFGNYWSGNPSKATIRKDESNTSVKTVSAIRGEKTLARETENWHDLEIFNGIFKLGTGRTENFSFSGCDNTDSLLFIKRLGNPDDESSEMQYIENENKNDYYQMFLALPCLQQTAFKSSGTTFLKRVALKLGKAVDNKVIKSEGFENFKNRTESEIRADADLITKWYNARGADNLDESFVNSGLCVDYDDFFSSIFYADYIINGETEYNVSNIKGRWAGKKPHQNLKKVLDIDKDITALLRYALVFGYKIGYIDKTNFNNVLSKDYEDVRLFVTSEDFEDATEGFEYHDLNENGTIDSTPCNAKAKKIEKNTVFARYIDRDAADDDSCTKLVFLYHVKPKLFADTEGTPGTLWEAIRKNALDSIDEDYKIDGVSDRRFYYSRLIKPFRSYLSNIIRKWNRMFNKHGIDKLLEYKKELEENIELLNSYKFTGNNVKCLNKNSVDYEELVDFIISEAKNDNRTYEFQNFTECTLSDLNTGDYFILTSGGTSGTGDENTENYVKLDKLPDAYNYSGDTVLYKKYLGTESYFKTLKEIRENSNYRSDEFGDDLYVKFVGDRVSSRTSYFLGFVGNGFVVGESPWELYRALRYGNNGKIAKQMYKQAVTDNMQYRINDIIPENGGFGALNVCISNQSSGSCGTFDSIAKFALYCDVDGGYGDGFSSKYTYSSGEDKGQMNGYYKLLSGDTTKLCEIIDKVDIDSENTDKGDETEYGKVDYYDTYGSINIVSGDDELENVIDYRLGLYGKDNQSYNLNSVFARDTDAGEYLLGVRKHGTKIKYNKETGAPEYNGIFSAYMLCPTIEKNEKTKKNHFIDTTKGDVNIKEFVIGEGIDCRTISKVWGPENNDKRKSIYQYPCNYLERIDYRNYGDYHSMGLNSCVEILNALITEKYSKQVSLATHSFGEFYLAAMKSQNKANIDKIMDEDKFLAHCQKSVLSTIHGNIKGCDIWYKDKKVSLDPTQSGTSKIIDTIILESHKRVVELAKKLSEVDGGENKIKQILYAGAASANGKKERNNRLSNHRALNMVSTFFKTTGKNKNCVTNLETKPRSTFVDVNEDGNDNRINQKFNRHSSMAINFEKERSGGVQFRSSISEAKKEKTSSKYHRYDYERQFFELLPYNAPLAYKNLVDKIRFFNPAFHAITPEGFNARLTFLQQCTRQGPTVSASDSTSTSDDYSASNLSFGRPPFCVLRLGDFLNTKIAINSINITYPDMLWDLNTEGIGVQPMLAKISMDIEILGGSSLEGPISKLQNAVSFNYYANTEIYDDRSDFYNVKDWKNGGTRDENDFRYWDPVMTNTGADTSSETSTTTTTTPTTGA